MNVSGTKLPPIEFARIRISEHHRFSQQCFKLRSAGARASAPAPTPAGLPRKGVAASVLRLRPASWGTAQPRPLSGILNRHRWHYLAVFQPLFSGFATDHHSRLADAADRRRLGPLLHVVELNSRYRS